MSWKKWLGLLFFGLFMLIVGFYLSFLATLAIETNDRLKYEVAYTKGYYSILKNLEKGDVEIAKKVSNILIEAHMVTLSEFDYLMNSVFWNDTAKELCELANYKLEATNIEVEQFAETVTEFSQKIIDDC